MHQQGWAAREGAQLQARTPGVPPGHWPGPAKGGQSWVTAGGHVPALPQGREPQYQAQALAQHRTVHPQVAGSASTEGWEPASAPRHGHSQLGLPTPAGRSRRAQRCRLGVRSGAGLEAQDRAQEEPALPTALSKSRFALTGVHWEFKLQHHEPSRGWHVPTAAGCKAPSILRALRAGGPNTAHSWGSRGLSLPCTPQQGPWLGAKQRRQGWTCWCMGQGHTLLLCTVPQALPSQGRAAPGPQAVPHCLLPEVSVGTAESKGVKSPCGVGWGEETLCFSRWEQKLPRV